MRTSLNELKAIDDHLFKRSSPADQTVFQARMILQPDLRNSIALQKQTLWLVEQYSRRALKAEIKEACDQVKRDPCETAFIARIRRLFR
ncbi:hypothetical protein [Hufsiella ginkgonis]|uniref:Uncharacterized protein n=1 Tax=Hufsiella ginkgonis TaxID=2695274 RepID=A0A7K1XWI5_9SPHI|nr:hypothetical protein [Hufsiella ginkgonis]MXV15335.1 hypothetical protein [Hufsiella ginkgonis]